MTDLTVSEPNEYNNFLQSDGPPFDELLKAVTLAVAKRDNNLREVVSNFQRFSFSLRCLANGNAFADLKFSLLTR